MGNRAYLNAWCREFPESTLPFTFQNFLETVPLSKSRPGFTQLSIRAVSYGEPPLIEHDLRAQPFDAAAIVAAATEILHDDVCYEVEAHWDLYTYDEKKKEWQLGPQRLEIICQAEHYDDGAWEQSGHFSVDLGFEDLFVGQGNLLGAAGAPAPLVMQAGEHPREREFRQFLERPGRLREYRENTQKNAKCLQDWVGRILSALPVAGVRLWSEGEESFEDRVDAILAGE